MADAMHEMPPPPGYDPATLALLRAVETEPTISQRSLAHRLNAALGLTNAYFKRAVRKGYIKVTQAPARRFAYYLTPLGFLEKARLTQEFLYHSLSFFRHARTECDELFAKASAMGVRRVALCGASEIAEIASLSATNQEIELVAVIDASTNRERFVGLPIFRSLAEVGPVDAVVVTDVQQPQTIYDQLAATLPQARIFHPAILHIKPRG